MPELPLLPLSYRDVLSPWESISMHTARTKNEIENEILWNNHEVTIGGKSVFYKQWYDAGVKTLPEILGKEGKFLAFTAIKKKYKINTNFLCYIDLCNAIPKHWRKVFRSDNENDLVVSDESVQPFKNLPPSWRQARAFYVSKSFQTLIHSFFFIRMLFSRVRLNILIFPPILGCKYSCIILNNSLWHFRIRIY